MEIQNPKRKGYTPILLVHESPTIGGAAQALHFLCVFYVKSVIVSGKHTEHRLELTTSMMLTHQCSLVNI